MTYFSSNFDKDLLLRLKGLWFFILFLSFEVFAETQVRPDCSNSFKFDIYVQNKTDSVCTIIDASFTHNKFRLYGSLKPNDATIIFRIEFYEASDLLVTYQCGDNKWITLKSEHNPRAYDGDYVKGQVQNYVGMDAKFFVRGDVCEPAIIWRLS